MEEINNNHNGSGMAIKYRLVGQVQGVGFRHYLLEKHRHKVLPAGRKTNAMAV